MRTLLDDSRTHRRRGRKPFKDKRMNATRAGSRREEKYSRKRKDRLSPVFSLQAKGLIFLVGARGFEPPTTCTPCRYATRLRYAPRARKYNRPFLQLEPPESQFVTKIACTAFTARAGRSRAAAPCATDRRQPSPYCPALRVPHPPRPAPPHPPPPHRTNRAGCARR